MNIKKKSGHALAEGGRYRITNWIRVTILSVVYYIIITSPVLHCACTFYVFVHRSLVLN